MNAARHGFFAYGTLMFPEVMERVVGRRPPGATAILAGYERHPVAGRNYPGILAAPGRTVAGVRYTGLSGADWARLDEFEGDFYERREVIVHAGHSPMPAFAYAVPEASSGLLAPGDWDPLLFQERDLPVFLNGA